MRPDWHDIETAPKDRPILLCRAGWLPVLGCWLDFDKLNLSIREHDAGSGVWMAFDPDGAFENDGELYHFATKGEYAPTHWAECPEGPDA